jgi:fimbrial isopeptide formation D2 family protein
LGAGSYAFDVVYSGDSNYSGPVTGSCEVFSVAKATPALATQLVSPSSSNLGNKWNDSATVTGVSTFAPSGSVRFLLCQSSSSSSCTGGSLVDVTLTAPTNTSGNVSTYELPASDAYTPTTVGTYCYNVSYAGDTNYNNVGEQSDTECFTVTEPNFTVLKTDTPGNGLPVTPGSTIPYTVTIQNVGDGAGSAVISDALPSSLTMQGTPTCKVTSPDTCTVNAPTTGSTWTFDVSLGVGDSAVVTFNATLAATDTADVVNTAQITQGNCNPNGIVTASALKGNAATTIQCSSTVTNPVPNFTVTKTDSPGNGQSVTAGATIPYTVVIKNVGDGAGAATITDTLPSNLTIKGTPTCAVTAPDTCTVTNTTGSTWTFAVNLAAGNSATVTFSATVAAAATGTITNTATITTGPCNTSSGCSSTVSNPIPPVTAPAVVTPPPPPAPAIAFTGAFLEGMWAVAAALLGLGGFLVLMARRRRKQRQAA